MTEIQEAIDQMLARAEPLRATGLPLLQALGRHAAREVLATVPLPGFDNSAMDGYALRAADAQPGANLTCVSTQAAGALEAPNPIGPGQTARIFTGAAIPPGADAVVMQEDAQRDGDTVHIHDPSLTPGQFIRRAGSDLCAGQIILRRGDLITPAVAGLLASQGRLQVDVTSTPRCTVITTGDEVVPPGTPLRPGQVYNSNSTMVQAMLQQSSITQITAAHAPDDLDATISTLRESLVKSDVLIITGGVSVGDRDLVKEALSRLGLKPDLWRVRMKPGKPFLFATGKVSGDQKYIFGLPGNPVSASVTFQVLVRPILARLSGSPHTTPPTQEATITEPLNNDGDRPLYLRGTLRQGHFHPTGLQRSDALYGLSQSNALLLLAPGETTPAGTRRSVLV